MSSNLDAIKEDGVFSGGGERDRIEMTVACVKEHSRSSTERMDEGKEGVVRIKSGYFEACR